MAGPLVSRRWSAGGRGRRSVPAGADCSTCGVAAEPVHAPDPQAGHWRCPRCGDTAPACLDGLGLKGCELVKGHEGDHESPSGTCWPRRVRYSRCDQERMTLVAEIMKRAGQPVTARAICHERDHGPTEGPRS